MLRGELSQLHQKQRLNTAFFELPRSTVRLHHSQHNQEAHQPGGSCCAVP